MATGSNATATLRPRRRGPATPCWLDRTRSCRLLLAALAAAMGAVGAQGAAGFLAAQSAGAATAGAEAATVPAGAACGGTSPAGTTPVVDASLDIRFVLPLDWLCVPGTGPLPATVNVLERVDTNATTLVDELRKAAVGGFELLQGGRIPCLVAVDQSGTGALPSASAWQQVIAGQAQASGTSLTGLQVKTVKVPAGEFLDASFSRTAPGGSVDFVDEYLGSVAAKLIAVQFSGAPASVVAQAKRVMATFR